MPTTNPDTPGRKQLTITLPYNLLERIETMATIENLPTASFIAALAETGYTFHSQLPSFQKKHEFWISRQLSVKEHMDGEVFDPEQSAAIVAKARERARRIVAGQELPPDYVKMATTPRNDVEEGKKVGGEGGKEGGEEGGGG